MSSRAEQLRSLGQSVWLDFIRRGHLVSGEFDRLVRDQGVVGVTSNPTIFQQALTHGDDYDAALTQLVARGLDAPASFDALAIEDIQAACDRLRPVFERTGGLDGRVSIEVNPKLASDTERTIAEARRLNREVARPNVMVKIPATAEGLPAIAAAIADGICVNVTLIFSLARYQQVMDAYLTGLERRLERGLPLEPVVSVASFFVSRVDTKVDSAIDRAAEKLPAGDPKRAELESLKGQAAVANARLAYASFKEQFATPRAAALRAKGARVQRPLWASTSTKNPAYPDTLYVDELIGPDTVNTMPPQTLEAYNDHGALEARIEHDLQRASELFERLPRLGVPIATLIDELEAEGVKAFAKSYEGLLEALEQKRGALASRPAAALRLPAGTAADAVRGRIAQLDRAGFIRRLWARDATLWGSDPAHQKVAANRLGWLRVAERMRSEVAPLEAFAREAAAEGFTHAVLLGMGGSSLAPEVMRQVFGVKPGALDLTVLDSTSPAAVRAVAAAHDPSRTLFVVSSKSGTTLEVLSFEKHFHAWVSARRGREAGRSFVAITDPGTPLEELARTRGYRRAFLNPPDIGGRYSALSYFGLLPAALGGVDLGELLDRVLAEAKASGPDAPPDGNLGLALGAALGVLALGGRDKVTLALGEEIQPLGSWIEQLLAESTGKDGKGLVPVAGEALAAPDAYGSDRVFVAFSTQPAQGRAAALDALEQAGHPVLRWQAPGPAALGAEFLRWEIATAVAGAVIGVDPFDEPNVTEAKQASQAALERFLEDGAFPSRGRLAEAGGVFVEAPKGVADSLAARAQGRQEPASWAAALLSLVRPGDYFALCAYLHRTPQRDRSLERLRLAARAATRAATTLGYGPRFLHSTGQLHKGGPNSGVFLQLTAEEGEELAIPGERFGFGALISAQAAGDYQVLERRGRRVMRIHLGSRPDKALDEIVEAIAAAKV